MKMKRLFIFCLMGLLFAACSKDEEDVYNIINDPVGIKFYGVWSIDDVPVEGTYETIFTPSMMNMYFSTFPYQALLNNILTGCKVTGSILLVVDVSMVGNTMTNSYYNANQNQKYGDLSFRVVTQDDRKAKITLGLKQDETIFSIGDSEASCILVVDHVDIDYENGEHKTLEPSPVRKLTFVSTKRIK